MFREKPLKLSRWKLTCDLRHVHVLVGSNELISQCSCLHLTQSHQLAKLTAERSIIGMRLDFLMQITFNPSNFEVCCLEDETFFVIFLMKDTHFTLVGDEISTALDQLSLQCCHSTGDGFNSLENCVENWLFKRPSVEWFCVLNLFVWNDDFAWEKEEREKWWKFRDYIVSGNFQHIFRLAKFTFNKLIVQCLSHQHLKSNINLFSDTFSEEFWCLILNFEHPSILMWTLWEQVIQRMFNFSNFKEEILMRIWNRKTFFFTLYVCRECYYQDEVWSK